MESRNVETYRAGHEAFNQRDFVAMTKQYADSITWTDHSQGRTFRTPQEFRTTSWQGGSGPRPTSGSPAPATSTLARRWCAPSPSSARMTGRSDRSPPPASEFALPLCEMWHFDSSGRVVGGDLYYDQVSLLTQLGLMPQPSGA